MKHSARTAQILHTLEELWKAEPKLRLGQIVLSAVNLSGTKLVSQELYSVSDEDILSGLEELLRHSKNA